MIDWKTIDTFPEKEGEYLLVVTLMGIGPKILIGHYLSGTDNNYWMGEDGYKIYDYITYWAPLPDLPNELLKDA